MDNLSAPLEDYLEAIKILQNENRVARAKDIADRLGVSRASVTSALKALSGKGLINYQPYSFITLTGAGEKVSQEIMRRHQVLTEFFRDILALSPELADANACRVEHSMDALAVDRLDALVGFLKGCPKAGDSWIKAMSQGRIASAESCQACEEGCASQKTTKRKKS